MSAMETDLGGGYAEVITRITREDGSVFELTINKMSVTSDLVHRSGAWFSLDDVSEDLPRFNGTHVPQPQEYVAEIRLRGKLLDPGNGALYRIGNKEAAQ